MSQEELLLKINDLLQHPESEVVEWKSSPKGHDQHGHQDQKAQIDTIANYFSALSIEANDRGEKFAYLIIGVNDKTRDLEGTDFLKNEAADGFDTLKKQLYRKSGEKHTVRNIYDLRLENGKHVLLIEIPAAPRGILIGNNGHYYQRNGSELISLTEALRERIAEQEKKFDWSLNIVNKATILDFDPDALKLARSKYAEHTSKMSPEIITSWSDEEFLKRLGAITEDNGVTRAGLLLMGKQESSFKLLPNPAELSWILERPMQKAVGEHFTIPFILTASEAFSKVQNYRFKETPYGSLLPVEILKYEESVVMEALNNAIAHQDYSLNERILFVENEAELYIRSAGDFYDGKPEDYAQGKRKASKYRNQCLVSLMENLGLIDKEGSGIQDMYLRQQRRYMPMPDYDISANYVKVTIYGKPVDKEYTQTLIREMNLSQEEVIALDKVQKHKELSNHEVALLRSKKLVEGNRTHLFISSIIAKATGNEVTYISKRGHDDKWYKKRIVDFIKEFDFASRKQINDLLIAKLPESLTDKQKETKISKLLTALREENIIFNSGSNKVPKWKIK
jgi:ATP-dependent DNA helicase RecG